VTRRNKNRSLSSRVIENYYRIRRYLIFRRLLCCLVIFPTACVVTYEITLMLSIATTLDAIVIKVILAILTLLASFKRSPSFLFVFSAFVGMITGAIIRCLAS